MIRRPTPVTWMRWPGGTKRRWTEARRDFLLY